MIKEYHTINEAAGPLMIVEKVAGVKYEELIEARMQNGEIHQGQALEIDGDKTTVQIFEGTSSIGIRDSRIRFLRHPLELGVSPDMIGRAFDGLGRLKDNELELLPGKKLDVNGEVINPVARDYPDEFIQAGISAIDHSDTLVRGQKLPVSSASGLPHKELMTQITGQANALNSEEEFAIVFAVIGVTFEETERFMEDFRQAGAVDRSVLFIDSANDPVIRRIATSRMALTAAKYLVYEKGTHVLVIMTGMTNYCEALWEISAVRREVSGRHGYPGYLYTDSAALYERAGRIRGPKGSVTRIPILAMPEEDETYPIPDLTGYIAGGQTISSRELYKSGIQPLIGVLSSLSRLKDEGTDEDKTRGDHAATMNQLFSTYAQGKQVKELVVTLGESILSDVDKVYAVFTQRSEEGYVNQGFDANRSIEETLDLGRELLSMLSRTELKRIKEGMFDRYLTGGK